MTLSPDAFATLLKRRAPWPAIAVAYVLFLQELLRLSGTAHNNDNRLVVEAVRKLFDGESPYESKRFLYPPSSVLFGLLQAPFSDATLHLVVPFVFGLALLIGWWAALRLFDVGLPSWLGTVGVAAFPLFHPAMSGVELRNWTMPVAGLMSVALLLMARGRWLAAGVVVGLSIAIKPMLAPIGLVFLLARRRTGFAAAAGIPIAACLLVLPLLPQPTLFLTKTLPFLLSGQDSFTRPYDSSLHAMLPRFGFDEPFVTIIRLAVLLATVAVAVLRWRRGGDERLRLVETSAILMLGTFLVMTPSFGFYPMIVVPTLVASIVAPGAAARSVGFSLSLVLLLHSVHIPLIDFLDGGYGSWRQAFKPLAWFLIVLILLGVAAWQRQPVDGTETSDAARDDAEAAPATGAVVPAPA